MNGATPHPYVSAMKCFSHPTLTRPLATLSRSRRRGNALQAERVFFPLPLSRICVHRCSSVVFNSPHPTLSPFEAERVFTP